jgi:hypothetical protein
VGHRQGPQQQRVDQPERRRASADRQAERENCGAGSDFILSELPPREDDICAQRIEPHEQLNVAGILAVMEGVSERPAGFGGVAAVFHGVVEVRLQLFVDLPGQPAAAENVRKSRP